MSYERFTDTNGDYGRRSGEPLDERPSPQNRSDHVDCDKEPVSNIPPAESNYQHYQRPNPSPRTSGVSPPENGRDRGNRDASGRDADYNDRVYDSGRRTRSRSISKDFHSGPESKVTRGKGSRLDDDYDREGGGGGGRRGEIRDRKLYGNGYSSSARGDDCHDRREIDRGGDDARGHTDPSASSNWRDAERGVDREAGAGDRKTGDRGSGRDSREPRRDYSWARDGRDAGRGVDQEAVAGDKKTRDRKSGGDSREPRRDYSGARDARDAGREVDQEAVAGDRKTGDRRSGGDYREMRRDYFGARDARDAGRGVDHEAVAGDQRTGDRVSGRDSREPRRDYFGTRKGRELSVVERDRGCDGRGMPKRGGYDGGSRGEFMVREDRERDWSRGRGVESRDDRGRGRDHGGGSFGGRDRGRNDSREMQRQQQRDQRDYGSRESFRGGSGGGRRDGREEFASRNRRYPEDDRRRRYPEREGVGRDSSFGDRRRGGGSRDDDSRPRVGGFSGGRADSRDRSRQREGDRRREVNRRGYGYGDTRDDGATGPRPRTSRLDSDSSHVGGFVDGQWVGGAGVSSDTGVQERENSKEYGDGGRAAPTTGGISSALTPVGSSSIVTSGLPVNSSGSGRPRWDKPAPGAVAKEAIAAIERKMSNNGPVAAQQQMNKKLVWGSGKSAGSKRPLWGGGGGAAGSEAKFATSPATGIGSGTPGGGGSSNIRVSGGCVYLLHCSLPRNPPLSC